MIIKYIFFVVGCFMGRVNSITLEWPALLKSIELPFFIQIKIRDQLKTKLKMAFYSNKNGRKIQKQKQNTVLTTNKNVQHDG